MDSSLGANLRRIRKEKKLTLKQLSEQTNLSVSFLSSIERGERTASLKALKSIAKALDVTVYILTGEPPVDLDDYDTKVELTDLITLRDWIKQQPVLFFKGKELTKESRMIFEELLDMVVDREVKKRQKKTPEKEPIV